MQEHANALKALAGLQSQVAIVVSTYNANITDKLLTGAVETLQKAGITQPNIVVSRVPGAWELPLAAKWLADLSTVGAVITLGAVIRGETSHDQHINRAVSLALMELMQSSGKPIAFWLTDLQLTRASFASRWRRRWQQRRRSRERSSLDAGAQAVAQKLRRTFATLSSQNRGLSAKHA